MILNDIVIKIYFENFWVGISFNIILGGGREVRPIILEKMISSLEL